MRQRQVRQESRRGQRTNGWERVHQREPSPETGMGSRAARGVLWLVAQRWAVRVGSFLTLLVLTRQLSPSQFGVVAAAMTVVPLVYLLADLGFSTYLLQSDKVDQLSLSTAFWASVAAGLVLSLGLVAVAPLLTVAFKTPGLTQVLQALVLAIAPTVMASVPMALLKRAMAFQAIAMQTVAAAVLAQVVAVVIAVLDGGVWALVAQTVVGQLVTCVLAFVGAKWLPSLTISTSQLKLMIIFGIRVSVVDLVATLRAWTETWIIANTLGMTALGLLSIAQKVVHVVQDLSAAPLVPVSTVVFAKVRDSSDRLLVAYLKALGVAYSVVGPLLVLLAVTAPVLVPLMFGERWSASTPVTQALAIAGIVTLGAMLDHGLFYGLGRPGAWLLYAVVVDVVTVSATYGAIRWGLIGIALSFIAVAVAATTARWVLVSRLLGVPVRQVARPFMILLGPIATSAGAGWLVLRSVEQAAPALPSLFATGLVVGAVFVGSLRVMARTVLVDALDLLPLPQALTGVAGRVLRLT